MTITTPPKIAIILEKDESYKVPTQAVEDMFAPYYSQPFWEILLQTTDHSYNTFSKPIGGSSPDSYHESINHPAVLPIGATAAAPRMVDLQSPLFNLIKDDVFLAQPSFARDAFDDNASLSSHSSSSQHSDKLSPCLSPVTSPTNFLYNHEPLFEGMEDLGNKKKDSIPQKDLLLIQDDDKQSLSTVGDDLDWFKLLDAFRADVVEDDQQSESSFTTLDNMTSSSSEDEDLEDEVIDYTLKKRKRSETPVSAMDELHLSDSILTKPKNATIQKRRKKNKSTSFTPRYKKYQKKKLSMDSTHDITFSLPVSLTITKQKTTNKDNSKKDESLLDQKESISSPTHCQLIEPITKEDDGKTVFQHLTKASIDWCRYCGTTEGVNWRPGPWGKRTLCNKHGCDYKGYGLASRLPRLDLSAFVNEKLEERIRPVVQQFCIVCQSPEQAENLVLCSGGCSRAYHQQCHSNPITVNPSIEAVRWYCSALCKENRKRNKVVVELPRKHMPLMHLLPSKNSSKKAI